MRRLDQCIWLLIRERSSCSLARSRTFFPRALRGLIAILTRFLSQRYRALLRVASGVKCGVNRILLLCLHFVHEALKVSRDISPFLGGCIAVCPSTSCGRSANSASLRALRPSVRTVDTVQGTVVSLIVGAALGSFVYGRSICFDVSAAVAA